MNTPPPLPTGSVAHGPSSAPPPKRGLSGCALYAVILAGVGVLSIPIIAILAAIAIPQYQDYVVRSKVGQGYAAAKDLQATIDLYRAEHDRCPDAQALGMAEAKTVKLAPNAAAEATFVLDASPPEGSAGCGFEMRLSNLSPAADGKTIHFISDANGWQCREGTLDTRLRPPQCR